MSAFPMLSALVLLSGCLPEWAPLGEDDLDGDGYTSQIDCNDADPDVHSDCVGLDTNPCSPGNDSAVDTEADSTPALASLEVEETSTTQLEFSFQVAQSSGNLEGGLLRLSHGNRQEDFMIPGSISDWDGSAGSVRINIWICELASGSQEWQATVFDAQGNESTPLITTVTSRFIGRSYLSIEWGDGPMLWDGPDSFEPPFLFCGDTYGTAEGYHSGSNPAAGDYGFWPAGADVDFIKVYAATWTNSHTATLNWNNTGTQLEFGRFLLNGGTWQHDSPVGGQSQPVVHPLHKTISANYQQYLYVRGYSGPATDWSVIIE
ncbi:MAG: hypothetical protein VX519_00540 [Myxococcota bacterium]|nr:hypothetical protein [Myxococcota bacterium]